MKAAIYDRAGPPDVIRYADIPDPVCTEESILIRVRAISIEGGDTINRAAVAPSHPAYIVGFAAAGEIVEVGRNVKQWRVGERVATFGLNGSHAELRVVPASQAWRMPEGLAFDKAAAIPVGFGTADHCLFAAGDLLAGEAVLIQAGAGGLGLAAIQLAHRAGAVVIATVSGEKRATQLAALGLDHAIDHRTEDVVSRVRHLTENRGVDLVIDPVGATLQDSLASLRTHGRLVFVGNAGGQSLTVDLWSAMQANIRLTGVFMGTELAGAGVRERIDRILAQAAAHQLNVVIDRTFCLSEAQDAHRYIEENPVFGRVILKP